MIFSSPSPFRADPRGCLQHSPFLENSFLLAPFPAGHFKTALEKKNLKLKISPSTPWLLLIRTMPKAAGVLLAVLFVMGLKELMCL